MCSVFLVLSFFGLTVKLIEASDSNATEETQLVSVQGRITIPPEMQPKVNNWFVETKVLLDYGRYAGFVKSDGSFSIDDVSSGSYILEVANADFMFESLRIDITNKGKIRARRLNLLQPSIVTIVPYPVQIAARQHVRYFRKREEWRVTDILMNPMIIMLVVAFILMVVTPKLASQDPQMQKEMQNLQLPKVDMPDMADMLANVFGSNAKKGKKGTNVPQQNRRATRLS